MSKILECNACHTKAETLYRGLCKTCAALPVYAEMFAPKKKSEKKKKAEGEEP